MSPDFTPDALTARGSASKQATRMHPIDLIRQHSSFLWSAKHQCLRYDWMELAGHHAPTLQTLLDEHALQDDPVHPRTCPTRFVGVDSDPDVIRGCQSRYGPRGTWHHGSLASALHPDAYPNTGVLVYDSFRSAHGQKSTRTDINAVGRFARQQFERLREFLLVVNVAADPRRVGDSEVAAYRKIIEDATGINTHPDAIHTYRSRWTPMLWTAFRFGF